MIPPPVVAATLAGDIVDVSLPNEPAAAGQARGVVRDTLTRWRLPLLIESCALAVSELVTNAVRHGRPPIGMRLRRRPRDVRLDVRDSDPQTGPAPDGGDAIKERESGRGLNIVQAIADDSGSEHIPGDGKTVFASWRTER